MQEQFETTVRVTGRGTSREAAFADALSGVQRAVMATGKRVLLRIEPQQVSVVKAEEFQTKERFLFFFLPRTRSRYAVSLDVAVSVTAIDAEQVVFTARQT